jgi:hypothetical protein
LAERGAVEIATDGRWGLYTRKTNSGGEWQNYYLRDWGAWLKKHAYHLGHNGARFAHTPQAEALFDQHPDVYAAVKDIIADHVRTAWLDGEHWRPLRWAAPGTGSPRADSPRASLGGVQRAVYDLIATAEPVERAALYDLAAGMSGGIWAGSGRGRREQARIAMRKLEAKGVLATISMVAPQNKKSQFVKINRKPS